MIFDIHNSNDLKNLREEVILDATKPKKEFPFNKPCIKQQKCIERKF